MAQRLSNYPVTRATVAEATNPSDNDVMADTGALPGGIYEVLCNMSCATAIAKVHVAQRNVDNDADVGAEMHFNIPQDSGRDVPLRFELEKNQRVVIRMAAAQTGTTACNITAQRVA